MEELLWLPPSWREPILHLRTLIESGIDIVRIPAFITMEERIIFYYAVFNNQKTVATFLRTSSKRVNRAVVEFRREHYIPQPLARGRPRKVCLDIVSRIEQMITNDHSLSVQRLQTILQSSPDSPVLLSVTTIRKILHALHFEYKPPKIRQLLTPLQIEKRKAFAVSALETQLCHANIIFCDESRFCLRNDGAWVWRRRGDHHKTVFREEEKFPIGVMVFGAIGPGYRSPLVFCDNTVGQYEYVEILQRATVFEDADRIYGKGGYIFQQDGAPCHTARRTRGWIRTKARLLNHWPANSPDLNVIEHI